MKTEYLTLGDVCTKGSSNIAQKDLEGNDGEYEIYGASGLIKKVNFFHQDKPYIAVVKDGAGVGRTMLLPAKSSVIGTMQYIIPCENVDIEYLYYAISYMDLSRYYMGAAIPHIYFKDYKNERLPVPDIDTQKHIAFELRLVDRLYTARQKQLAKLNELIASRFIEMFGDFDLTYQKKDWKPISDIGTVVGGSTPKTNVEEYWNGEYRWISPAELQQDSGVIYESVKKITKAGIESCSLQELPVGTVILSSRAPIGKVAIAGKTFYCNQGFKNIVCKEVIRPRYLYSLLLFNTEYLNSLGRGATFKEISKSIVESIKIPVPKIEKQIEFEDFVEHLDKSKLAVQKSLEQLETLKKSLMQKYFG